jgi:hypothetical protein
MISNYNFVAEISRSVLFGNRKLYLHIDGKVYKFSQLRKIHLCFAPGQYWVEVRSGKLSSKRVLVDVKENEVLHLKIKNRISLLIAIFSNLLVLMFLIFTFDYPDYRVFFWLMMALNSFIPVYFLYLKRDRFYSIRQI